MVTVGYNLGNRPIAKPRSGWEVATWSDAVDLSQTWNWKLAARVTEKSYQTVYGKEQTSV
jgi:hypothetical protein